jgi:rhamnose utilization protein RhaD (predicted bifunctional aldolase and dehydrogenase)
MLIAILLAAPVVALVDAKIVNHFFPDEEVFNRDIIEELLNYIFGIVVWIPYLLVSKRVAITFTK